jgi:hypothetical protein
MIEISSGMSRRRSTPVPSSKGALVSAERMSSFGEDLRASNSDCQYFCSSTTLRAAAIRSASEIITPSPATEASDQRFTCWRTSGFMHKKWPMTRIGSGIASVAITSTRPRSGHASRISSVSSRITGSSARMRRVESALPTVLR